ncbi:MAG: hypothetical protein DCC68_09165 [Planctomycetota bacterium]|nr:MAG: hypothetical protein DCC68_09165 [Planctomycetota bacterium]
MRTGNPVLTQDVFRIEQPTAAAATTMTINGTVAKTGILLAITVAAAAVSWVQILKSPEFIMTFVWGGLIGGGIAGVAIFFKPSWSPAVAPIYALCEGLFLGAISLFADAYAREISGASIVPQAMILTFGTLASMLVAYRAGLVRATEKFRFVIVAAIGGICLVYLATIVLRMFGSDIPFIHGGGPIGIGFSVVVLIVAALSLVLDFDLIERGANEGAAKYMEWYGAYALLVTLVWLYIEFLKLLMKLQRRD